MWRLVWHQIMHRAGRSVALALAIVVAGTGFTVLTASSEASRLATTGTVKANSRTLYDILVRSASMRPHQRLRSSRPRLVPRAVTEKHTW